MSSNYPYGGPQPPMPPHGQDPGTDPAQPSTYRYPQQPTPDNPTTASGYSFGPFAPDEQPTAWLGGPEPDPYWGPAGPYGRKPAPPPPQPKGKGKVWIIIGAAALAVILMAVTAVILATRGIPGANPQSGSTAGQQTNPQNGARQASRPSDPVAAYLEALAAGDATAALSYAADPAPTGPLLTDKVLAESMKRTPLTEIDVPVVENQNANSVSATYKLGKSNVSETFDVVKVADRWKLSRAVKDLDIAFLIDGPVPVRINGVKVTEESVAVLPGSYAFTTGLPYVGYGSKNVVLVKSPYVQADTFNIQSQLTSSGKKAAISAAKKSYNKCLQAHSLNPRNCPQKFNSKYRYDTSTITWQQVGSDPFRKPSVTFSGTQARVEIPLDLKLTGSCTYQGRAGNCSGTLKGNSVAVIKVTTKPLKAKWL
jgi:hypothetical protein